VKEYELNDLSREILDSYEEVNLFYRISSALGTAHDIEGVCSVILRNVCEIIRVNRASILLLDEKKRELYGAAAVGIPDEDLREIRVRVGEGISGKVLESRTPQLVDDIRHLPGGLLSGYEEYATRSFISVPLLVERGGEESPAASGVLNIGDRSWVAEPRGRAIGVINMTDKADNAIFTSGDLKLLTALANQAAVLIENIRLIEFEKELRIARDIQESLLPEAPPKVPGVDLAGSCVPARNVGGDYYDFILREEEGDLATVIADVSGHNVASALMMAVARSAMRRNLCLLSDPGEVLRRLNSFMYDDLTRSELFLSALCWVYEPGTRKLRVANAGHNPALLSRPSEGGCRLLDAEGLLSGVVPDCDYPYEEYDLEPGDVVLLYTDGIVEAMDPSRIMFGLDRLADSLERHRDQSAAGIIDRIFEDVYSFSGEGAQADDMTAVALKVGPPQDR
jgi:serine phosphatase RsbU (regulator of sigma subunit)